MEEDAYSPEEMALMSAAFDIAWSRLEQEPTQAAQLLMATRIIAGIRAGEQDVQRLSRLALGEPVEQAPGDDDVAPGPDDASPGDADEPAEQLQHGEPAEQANG